MILITVSFDREWLKGLPAGAADPVESVSNYVKGNSKGECVEQSADSCKIVIDSELADELESKIKAYLTLVYRMPVQAVNFTRSEYGAEENQGGEESKPGTAKSVMDSLLSDIASLSKKKRSVRDAEFLEEKRPEAREDKYAPKSEAVSAENELLGELIGADEFKELIREIHKIAPVLKKFNSVDSFLSRNYLFSVNSGHGMSTYAKIFAETLNNLGLMKINGNRPLIKVKLPSASEKDLFRKIVGAILNDASDCVLVIDISDIMSSMNEPEVREAISDIISHTENVVIIFTVPFLESNVLFRISAQLNDLTTVKTVSIAPFTTEQMLGYAEKRFKKNGFTVEDGSMDAFAVRISEEKTDGRFYGIKTLDKIVNEVTYQSLLENGEPRVTPECIRATMLNLDSYEEYTYETLENMVGMEKIKERLAEIVAQIKLALNNDDVETPCIHMSFVGNPGTGKTTVARALGNILRDEKVLRNGSFFEYEGRDLCGRYIGETAPKTAAICRDAYGSVLFIDEAYTLYRGDDNDRDYGREALDMLVSEMENHRSDFVVIMAGYTDDMNTMISGNAGLRSRMPFQIVFPNYTREQLAEIFFRMAEKSFTLDDSVREAVKHYFNTLPDEVLNAKSFSNARYVRNLFERTWGKAMMRAQLGSGERKILAEDFVTASGDSDFSFTDEKKTRIGF